MSVLMDPLAGWCDEHRGMVEPEPASDVAMSALLSALEEAAFYETAYRVANGRPLGGGMPDEVPEDERPSMDAIREAADWHSPLCCFLEEHGRLADVVAGEA